MQSFGQIFSFKLIDFQIIFINQLAIECLVFPRTACSSSWILFQIFKIISINKNAYGSRYWVLTPSPCTLVTVNEDKIRTLEFFVHFQILGIIIVYSFTRILWQTPKCMVTVSIGKARWFKWMWMEHIGLMLSKLLPCVWKDLYVFIMISICLPWSLFTMISICLPRSLCLYHDLYVFTMISICLPWPLCVYHDLFVFTTIYLCLPWYLCVYHDLYVFTTIYHFHSTYIYFFLVIYLCSNPVTTFSTQRVPSFSLSVFPVIPHFKFSKMLIKW